MEAMRGSAGLLQRRSQPVSVFLRPNGDVRPGWHRIVLLHFVREDIDGNSWNALKDILQQPSAAFCLGLAFFCAGHAADAFSYLPVSGPGCCSTVE